jgi:hypothetical protein
MPKIKAFFSIKSMMTLQVGRDSTDGLALGCLSKNSFCTNENLSTSFSLHFTFWFPSSYLLTLVPWYSSAFVFISLYIPQWNSLSLWKRVILLKLFRTLEPLVHAHEICKIACCRHDEVSTNILNVPFRLLQDIVTSQFVIYLTWWRFHANYYCRTLPHTSNIQLFYTCSWSLFGFSNRF